MYILRICCFMLLSSCDTCSSGNFYYKLNVSFHSHVCTLKYSSSFAPDPSLKLPVVNPRAREGAIPKTKQPQPPPSTVKPDVGEKMLIGAPGSQSDLNLNPPYQGEILVINVLNLGVSTLQSQLKVLSGMLLIVQFFVILQYKMKVKIPGSSQEKVTLAPRQHHHHPLLYCTHE